MIPTASEYVADPKELLRHTAWARRLARTLTGADANADDLVQDGLLSVWRRPPPDPTAPLRPWLRVLLRNRSINGAREDRRREAREAAAPRGPEVASPEELVGRDQIHELLAAAVLALPEPYRQTVLLRYFEERPSSEIAALMGVPAVTVRGRLKTAIGMLRDALAAHDGGRFDWMAALGGLLEGAPNAALSQPPRTTAFRTPGRMAQGRAGAGVGTAVPGAGLAAAAKVAVVAAISAVALVSVQVVRPRAASRSSVEEAVAGNPTSATASDVSPRLPSEARLERDVPRRQHQASSWVANLTSARGVLPQPALSLPSTPGPTGTMPSFAASPSPCRFSEGPGPVFDACRDLGRSGAKKVMKEIVREARRMGRKETCEGCHDLDLDRWALTGDARQRLDEILKAFGQDKRWLPLRSR